MHDTALPPPTPDWPVLVETIHGRVLHVSEGIVATVPAPGAVQREEIARAQLDRLYALARMSGCRLGNLVFVDNVRSQDPGARRVWSREIDPALIYGTALVCTSLLARTIGTFFLTLERPAVPARMFERVDSALAWLRERNASHGGPVGGFVATAGR